MQFLRTLGLLVVLIMSNTGIASGYNYSLPLSEKDQVEFEYTQDQQNLSESTLITPVDVQTSRIIILAALVPEGLCSRKISRLNSYLVYSRTIVPSLDVTDIIFPFHSFL